jgi:hypothetical protein
MTSRTAQYEILERVLEAEKAERTAREEWHTQYRRDVLNPVMASLQAECAKIGHVDDGRHQRNWVGDREWVYCGYCRALMETKQL